MMNSYRVKYRVSKAQNVHTCLDIQLRSPVKISGFSQHIIYFSLFITILHSINWLGQIGRFKEIPNFSIASWRFTKPTIKISAQET